MPTEITGVQFPLLGPHGETVTFSNLEVGNGNGLREVTHNYCDSCTWWQESSEIIAETCSTGDQLIYTLTNASNGNIVDLRHGRLPFENQITVSTKAPNDNTLTNLVPTVLVDASPLAQSNEDADSGDDRYVIDYEAGKVTFSVARGGAEAITMTFRRAGSSKWTIKPPAGQFYVVEDAEVDLTSNLDINAHFVSKVFGSHTTETNGDIVNVFTRTYKNFHDFQAAARRFWGPIPAGFGGTGGLNTEKWTFEWQYSRADEYYDTANYLDTHGNDKVTINYVETSIMGDMPYPSTDSERAIMTVTFYGKKSEEP